MAVRDSREECAEIITGDEMTLREAADLIIQDAKRAAVHYFEVKQRVYTKSPGDPDSLSFILDGLARLDIPPVDPVITDAFIRLYCAVMETYTIAEMERKADGHGEIRAGR